MSEPTPDDPRPTVEDRTAAQRIDAAERLGATLSELVDVYGEMRALMDVSRSRPWTAFEFGRYLELRRRQGRLSRAYHAALARHERAREREWASGAELRSPE